MNRENNLHGLSVLNHVFGYLVIYLSQVINLFLTMHKLMNVGNKYKQKYLLDENILIFLPNFLLK